MSFKNLYFEQYKQRPNHFLHVCYICQGLSEYKIWCAFIPFTYTNNENRAKHIMESLRFRQYTLDEYESL